MFLRGGVVDFNANGQRGHACRFSLWKKIEIMFEIAGAKLWKSASDTNF